MKLTYISLFLLSTSVNSKLIPHPNKYAKLKCSQKPGYLIDLNPSKFLTKNKSKIVNGKRVVERNPNIDYRSKTLQHTKVQEQLGQTCYASTASLMLEAYLGHPVSANQLALISKASKIRSTSRLYKNENGENSALAGGTACDTIKAVTKSKVPICNRKLVPLETLQLNYSEAGEFYQELTKFYDDHNLSDKDKEALKLAAQKAKDSTYPNCSNEKELKYNATVTIKNYLYEINDINKEYCEENFEEEIEKCLKSFPTIFKEDGSREELTDEQFDRLDFLKFTESMNIEVEDFLKSIKAQSLNAQSIKDIDQLMYNHFLRTLASKFKTDSKYVKDIPNPASFMKEQLERIKNKFSDSDRIEEEVKSLAFYSDMETCKQYEKLKIYDDTLKVQICDKNSSLLNIFQKIKSVSHYFFGSPEFIDTLLESLDNNRSPYDFLDQLIGNECKKQGKPLPEGISCIGHIFPFRSKREFLQKEKTLIRNEKFRSTRKLRDFIFTQLNKTVPSGLVGNPVAVSVCTKFMDIKNYDFNWKSFKRNSPLDHINDCEQSDKYGLHEMTVTGMRCKDGKVQYKIQNSWGKDAKYKNPDLEVVPGQGSFWVSEKDLVNNIFEFKALKF